MDAALHVQFERVEAALTALVDSIATFNPSPQAALDLVAADDDLSHGLHQLSQHQANNTRILALRSEADALEARLKASVAALATLRSELLDVPVTPYPDESRPVPAGELLQYAMNISQYTVPPTYREEIPDAEEDKDKEDGASPGEPTNGAATPAAAGAPVDTDANSEETAEGNKVTPKQAQWLEKMQAHGMSWTPWPDNNKIRSGNLMLVQYLLDQDRDPWTDQVTTQQEMEAVALKQKEAGDTEKAQAEAKAHASEQAQAEAHARTQAQPQAHEPVPPPAPRAEPQPLEQFKGFDFDEDEDDED